MSKSRPRSLFVLVASLAILVLCASAVAQLTNGTLVGTVKDQEGALVAGAKITVRNTATNETRTDDTDTNGLYRIPTLPPGSYEVRVEKAGFRRAVSSNVVLHVGETTRVDVSLQVGVVEQQVEVTAGAPLVNTEEGSVTNIVEQKQVQELPLVRRNIYQLPVLEPGTQPTRVVIPSYYNNSVYDLGFTSFGKRIRSTNFMLDGAPNNDNGIGGVPAIAPILDAVQEFQVSTNDFAREFGRNFGSVINVATRSGTNSLHGSAWEFHRNAAVNAKNFFDTNQPSALIHNQFGFTLGGPLRKDKTFWFMAYEGFREKRGTTRRVQTETPELRAWVHANRPGTVADYLFQNFPGPVPTQQITDEGAPGAIGPDNAFGFSPIPDGIPDFGVGVGQQINHTQTDQYLLRVDHNFRLNDKVFVRWAGYYPRTTGAGEFTTIGRLGRGLRGFRRPADGFIGNLSVGYTHIFSQNVVNDLRFGYIRNRALTEPFPDNVPNIVMDDFTLGFGSDFFLPLNFTNNGFNIKDNLFWTHGRHGFKFGVEYNHDLEHSQFDAVSRGFYEFANVLDFVSDAPYLQFQHIDPSTGQSIINSPNRTRDFRRRDFSFFIQDDWKARKNLTINIGLRYEYFGVLQETNGKQGGIVLGSGSSFQEQFINASFAKVDQLYQPYRKNFAPLLGLAWDPGGNGKFSVRAAWAINYDRIHNDLLSEPARFSPPFGAFAVAVPLLGVCNASIPYSVSDVIKFPPTPDPDFAAPLLPNGAMSLCRFSPYFIDPHLKTPYVEQWNLTLQYAFARDWVVELGYAGNQGHRLSFTNDPNRVTGGYQGIPFNRPNPNLLWVSYLTTDSNSNYNGGSVQLKKRFSHGYLFQGSYTFGKVLDIQDDAFAGDFVGAGTGYFGTQDQNNRRLDYGRSSFDIRHRVTANFVYEMPVLKNKSPLMRNTLGGWQFNTIFSYESGRPFTVFNSVADYNADGGGGTQGGGYDRPNAPAFGNTIGCPSTQKFVTGMFQPGDFPAPALGVDGNLGRNTFCGPSYKGVDISLVKNWSLTPLGEGAKLQFRVEAFNAFNRVNLWLPDSDLAGDPKTFGTSSQAFPPREFQFGLKLTW